MATAKKVKRERSTSTTGHYVRNADLLPAVIEAKELGKVTDKLVKMLWLIAERYSRKGNFVGYSFREDMVSAAVENLCKNALKFNHEKYSNPFAFYTTAIHNSFLQFMADEKKHRNIRDALLIDAGANPSFNFGQSEKSESDLALPESDEASYEFKKLEDEITPVSNPTADSEDRDTVVKKSTVRDAGRAPGQVLKMSAGDLVYDEERGIYVRKTGA